MSTDDPNRPDPAAPLPPAQPAPTPAAGEAAGPPPTPPVGPAAGAPPVAPPTSAKAGWLHRAFGLRSVVAVGLAGLIVGAGAGVGTALLVDDDGRDGRPNWGEMGPPDGLPGGGQMPGRGQFPDGQQGGPQGSDQAPPDMQQDAPQGDSGTSEEQSAS